METKLILFLTVRIIIEYAFLFISLSLTANMVDGVSRVEQRRRAVALAIAQTAGRRHVRPSCP
jgi:hypothetical protein